MTSGISQLSHWGAYLAEVSDNEIVEVTPHPLDHDPSPLLGNIPGSTTSPARIKRPAIRKGWLENGPGATDKRGIDPFVEVEWDRALDLLALELERVVDTHGPPPSTAAPMAGRARGGSITRRAICGVS